MNLNTVVVIIEVRGKDVVELFSQKSSIFVCVRDDEMREKLFIYYFHSLEKKNTTVPERIRIVSHLSRYPFYYSSFKSKSRAHENT